MGFSGYLIASKSHILDFMRFQLGYSGRALRRWLGLHAVTKPVPTVVMSYMPMYRMRAVAGCVKTNPVKSCEAVALGLMLSSRIVSLHHGDLRALLHAMRSPYRPARFFHLRYPVS